MRAGMRGGSELSGASFSGAHGIAFVPGTLRRTVLARSGSTALGPSRNDSANGHFDGSAGARRGAGHRRCGSSVAGSAGRKRYWLFRAWRGGALWRDLCPTQVVELGLRHSVRTKHLHEQWCGTRVIYLLGRELLIKNTSRSIENRSYFSLGEEGMKPSAILRGLVCQPYRLLLPSGCSTQYGFASVRQCVSASG
jgi:hypothetical protein